MTSIVIRFTGMKPKRAQIDKKYVRCIKEYCSGRGKLKQESLQLLADSFLSLSSCGLWSTSGWQRSKASSSHCTHSWAPSACGWRGDESSNRGRFCRSLALSEANSAAVITANLLCHSAAISSNAFISFPKPFTASSSFLIRQDFPPMWSFCSRRNDSSS